MNDQAGVDTSRIISPFWTLEEAAQYLRVHVCTLQGLCRTGQIPAQRVGRQWRLLKHDIDAKFGVTAADAGRTVAPGQV